MISFHSLHFNSLQFQYANVIHFEIMRCISLPRIIYVSNLKSYRLSMSQQEPSAPTRRHSRVIQNMFFTSRFPSPKVAVIGGGSWGTAIARLIALNQLSRGHLAASPEHPRSPVPAGLPHRRHSPPPGLSHSGNSSNHSRSSHSTSRSSDRQPVPTVHMWVHEEMIHGERLTDIINQRHENIKYLPRINLPENLIATSNLEEAVSGANVLIFAIPHQFLHSVLRNLTTLTSWQVSRETIAVSLIKGLEVTRDVNDMNRLVLKPYSEVIRSVLGVENVAVVMGANVAMDIAHDHFAETTVACQDLNIANYLAVYLLRNDQFHVQITNDVSTVEYCGALKNIVALGAGFCDGLDMEVSTKAAVIRQGLEEMVTFCDVFDRTGNFEVTTVFNYLICLSNVLIFCLSLDAYHVLVLWCRRFDRN